MADEIPFSGPGGPIDNEPGPPGSGQPSGTQGAAAPKDLLIVRILYAIGFAVVAWVMFWLIVLVLAPMQLIHMAVTGKGNEELRQLSRRAVHYMMELLAYVTASSDDKPFPFGPFPQN